MTPFEFIVIGTPKSVQARNTAKAAWKAEVRTAASGAMPKLQTLATANLRVTIVYFYVANDLDLDNILKLILDAMIGVVYDDDDQVVDLIAAKRDISFPYTLTGVSPVLAAHLTSRSGSASDFVYIRVEEAESGGIP
jgi:crossover junction endodeoxyribonuclease RusA